jgi:cyclophilin family peptidyl-prolyl cis-trans isomerase/Arc/MetJ family transcription regulator
MALMRDNQVTGLAITAALRARPDGADVAVAKFLTDPDARIRADAANTLTRLRAKNANETLRKMLGTDADAVTRANAARALGAAEDKEAYDVLLRSATGDPDPRVRVSAIRSVAALKDAKAVDKLLEHGRKLLALHVKSRLIEPNETGELLEISTALGRLLPNTEDDRAVTFINEFRMSDGFVSPENEIALARVAPKAYVAARLPDDFGYREPRTASAYAQGLAEIATTKDESLKMETAQKLTAYIAGMTKGVRPVDRAKMQNAMPDLMQALAAFKPDNLDEILRGQLGNPDVFIRASAAPLVADRPKTKENVDALKAAYIKSTINDTHENDAKLALLDALAKLDKSAGVGTFLMALNDQDYLIRKKAFEILGDKELHKNFPGIPSSLENAFKNKRDQVEPYRFGTRLGKVLNTDADYRRAVSRKNGSVKAVFSSEKGSFTIDFTPEEAPLAVDNFVKLARTGYFNGLMVHRVVPNFVMQDGDPRGDGNGGPGWSIRCEVNMLAYDRGAVGMALSGKDTGGSQWFVTHSPQPHLDGGYTVFGHVNETDMKVVDNIVRGDKIISVKIVETLKPRTKK